MPSRDLGARVSPPACELNKEVPPVPPVPRRAPPLKGSVAADSPRPAPEKSAACMESAPKAGTLYKEPPMPKKAAAVTNSAGTAISQARYKEPPMRKAQQATAQIPQVPSPASPQRSEPATKVESVAHRDFEDEFDDATRWAEASAPPSKAPPADSPYYRVMPAPKKTPELEHEVSLPPSCANLTGEEDRSAALAVAAARSKSAPSQPDVAPEQAAKSSRYKAPPAEWVRNGSVPAVPREESEASSITGSVTSLRQGSRVKAPPVRPAAPTRPPPAARK